MAERAGEAQAGTATVDAVGAHGAPARGALAGAVSEMLDENVAAAVSLGVLPRVCAVNLRGDGADGRFMRAAARAVGVALPKGPNTWAAAGTRRAVWLSPDEWLLLDDAGFDGRGDDGRGGESGGGSAGEGGDARGADADRVDAGVGDQGDKDGGHDGRGADAGAALAEMLDAALAKFHHAVNDVSGATALVRVAGPEARAVLARGCPIDLHPRVFAPPASAATRIAKAQALVMAVSADPAFDIVVRRSFAEYLWTWLLQAASTYEPAVGTIASLRTRG